MNKDVNGNRSLVLISILAVGCFLAFTVAAPDTHASQHSSLSATQEEYKTLQPVHYTSGQLAEILIVGKSQHIAIPFVLTKNGGPSGTYKLVSVHGGRDVLELRYQNLLVLQARYMDDIANHMDLFAKGNKVNQSHALKLSDGIEANWWQIHYRTGSIVQMLTLEKNHVHIALIWSSAQSVEKPLVQAIAESLIPVRRLV